MSMHIVKQPDGQWCVFETMIDDIVLFDASAEEAIEFVAEEAAQRAASSARNHAKRTIERGGTPRQSFLYVP